MSTRVYAIPADADFLALLVRAILAGGFPVPDTPAPGPLDLARWTILVPTRRAARALQQAFLEQSTARARLLPQIKPLGDIDEDMQDDGLGAEDLSLPPVLDPLAREFLLIRLIGEWAKAHPRQLLAQEIVRSPARMLALSISLCDLIDGFETEEIGLDQLSELFGGDLAVHREAILGFLAIIRVELPAMLDKLGMLGPMRRRSLMIEREAERLAAHPPKHPVIAAGSTGSIPATARLITVIAALERGAVVLPGLDMGMDEASWSSLEPQHAQFGMKTLLARMEVQRGAVLPLPGVAAVASDRVWLASEIMRPTPTTGLWQQVIAGSKARIAAGAQGVELLEAASRHEEAAAVALIMREALETPGRTAALVTPDRDLARRVKAELGRWQVEVDDSAGERLIRTSPGMLLALLIDAAQSLFAAPALVALIQHPLVRSGHAGRLFETAVLRQRRLRPGLDGIAHAVAAARLESKSDEPVHPHVRRIGNAEWGELARFAEGLVRKLGPLERIARAKEPLRLADLIEAFATCAEALAGRDLWSDEAGEASADLLVALRRQSDYLPDSPFETHIAVLRHRLRITPVRALAPAHPRLRIYGLLEARLIAADVKILGGLNEGIWPGHPDTGPWLSRPMRDTLKLQPPERQIGLTAHDFVQTFSAPKVHLTWCRRLGDEPAVASRWVLRLKMLLESSGVEIGAPPWPSWARALDAPLRLAPVAKPRPKPPVAARPKRLSVTRIEQLIRDPYAIYARSILRLQPLPELAAKPDAAMRGNLVHEALHRFSARYPGALPDNAADELIVLGRAVFAGVMDDPDAASFWWPRFLRIAAWFVVEDRRLRQDARQVRTEVPGEIVLALPQDEFSLTARADRIDLLDDGSARIIDYKTGEPPTRTQVESGLSPQLTLEAAMLARGGFADIGQAKPSQLVYIKLSGGEPAGRITAVAGANARELAEEHLARLAELLARYGEAAQPYLPRNAYQYQDDILEYDHLSRFKEWSLSGRTR